MALKVLPDPTYMTWESWQETAVGFNPELSNQLFWKGQSWKEFGQRMTLIEPATPRPEFFRSWQSWVLAVKQALQV